MKRRIMMTDALKKYSILLVAASVVLLGVSVWGTMTEWGKIWVNPNYYLLLVLMLVVHWLVFAFTQKSTRQKNQNPLRIYQTAKFVKLFLFLIAILFYAFVIAAADKKLAMSFMLTFMAYYVVFTILETFFLRYWMKTLQPDDHL